MTRHNVEIPRDTKAMSFLHHNGIVQRIKEEFKMQGYDVYDGMAPVKYLPKLKKVLGKDTKSRRVF